MDQRQLREGVPMTDDLTNPRSPPRPTSRRQQDDEALPDVKNDPIPEPAQEDDATTSPEGA